MLRQSSKVIVYVYFHQRSVKPSLSHFVLVDVNFNIYVFVIYVIVLLVCGLKPRVPSDPREAFITILQKLPEMAHLFAVGVRKQS